jgi:hypothetical protein
LNLTAQQIINKRKEQWQLHTNIKKDEEYVNMVVKHIQESESIRQEIKNNPELLIEMCFVVVDKDQNTIPFFLNDVQQMFLKDLNQAIQDFKNKKRLHLKFLVLKGRQQGFTQVISAYQLANAIIRENFSGITIADNIENAGTIFQKKAKYQYDHFPDALKPSTKFNNVREFLFDKLNSSWFVNTAENKEVGRSNTLNFFHGSEAAFWKSISKIITGLGEALTRNSIQILESTANGYNEFKDLWDDAPNNTWETKFYQWWLTPEYRMDFESEEKQNQFITFVHNGNSNLRKENDIFKKLKFLLENHNLDYTQLYWYYNKWKGYIDKEKIKQEYPCSPAEAFLASGRCVFDKETIVQRIDYLTKLYDKQPPKRGYFIFKWNNPETMDFILDNSIQFVEDSQGYIRIYEDVKKGYPYVIGGDTKGEGKDFYAGTVINNITGIRVATIHVQISNSKPYTHQMYCLGKYFNEALIGIEMNWNTAPIEELERLKYPKQYIRQKYDSIAKAYEKKHGWKTDPNTRPAMIDKEVNLIENNIDLFTDITMLNEALTFVYDKDNRPDAESGKHDDLLISDMIAKEIRSQQRYDVIQVNKPRNEYDEPNSEEKYHQMVKDITGGSIPKDFFKFN